MSSFLDEAMNGYRPSSSADVEISLPTRRDPKAAPAEDRDLGQHGGGAEGTPAATETHSDTASSNAAEPSPQRDEPDDGEHTDSTEEQVEARARKAAEQAGEPEEPAAVIQRPAHALDEEVVAVVADLHSRPEPAKASLATTEGTDPREFKRVGFSAGDGTPTLVVKRFPQPAVDRLRLMLAATLGGEFAEAISAPALLTAYLIASMGVELDVDENTAVAAEAFRRSDPRLTVLEDRVESLIDNVSELAGAMKLSLGRIADTGTNVETMEFALAYLVADRVAQLTTPETTERNVNVAQKKALQVRERIRAQAKEQRTIEKQQDGRRMS